MSQGAFARCPAFDGRVRCRRKAGHAGDHKGWATGSLNAADREPRTWSATCEDTPRGAASDARIAALYVAADGPYSARAGVDPWPEARDARLYVGNLPAVAHPPCGPWGFGARMTGDVGDDGGCFAHALATVRRVGGVIEHPRASNAWEAFRLPVPTGKGWTLPDEFGGRSCYVDQGAYGHVAKKPTWLYAVLPEFPQLDWTRVWGRPTIGGKVWAVNRRQRILTPEPFADLLIEMASSCIGWTPRPRRQAVLDLGAA